MVKGWRAQMEFVTVPQLHFELTGLLVRELQIQYPVNRARSLISTFFEAEVLLHYHSLFALDNSCKRLGRYMLQNAPFMVHLNSVLTWPTTVNL